MDTALCYAERCRLLGIDASVRCIRQSSGAAMPVAIATPNKEMTTLNNTYEVVVSSPMSELPGKAVVKERSKLLQKPSWASF
ncbi:MAG: hypothetical protein JW850_13035 [Thermoflexales bacterium]|nr:hypothetical protein [Thermoflexales bacterium]